jgi:hypothetical protein
MQPYLGVCINVLPGLQFKITGTDGDKFLSAEARFQQQYRPVEIVDFSRGGRSTE